MPEEVEANLQHKPYIVGAIIRNEYYLEICPYFGNPKYTKVNPMRVPVSILQPGVTGVPMMPIPQEQWNPQSYQLVRMDTSSLMN